MTASPPASGRPTLVVHTVYFSDGDRPATEALGLELFEILTGPIEDPLAFGPGIPVSVATWIDLQRPDELHTHADNVVIVAIVGPESFGDESLRNGILARMQTWASRPTVTLLPLPTTVAWLDADLPATPQRALLDASSEGQQQAAVRTIVLQLCRSLTRPSEGRATLFISYAVADERNTRNAAAKLKTYIGTATPDGVYFGRALLLPGESIHDQLDEKTARGVFIAIRGDSYSTRSWCLRQLLNAKRAGLPTLTVEVLTRGENRSAAYAGNGPTTVWADDPASVATRAMVEWLRARHFQREAGRVIDEVGLPDCAVLCRAPELLDLAQGTVERDRTVTVLYPDPELSVAEKNILFRAQRRIRLVTPTTVYRGVTSLREELRSRSETPLSGRRVAMSLSDSPDANGPLGFTSAHVRAATVHLVRTLVSAGGAIAYGGDFRTIRYGKGTGSTAFTDLLESVIIAYNAVSKNHAQLLHSYIAPPLDVPRDARVTRHYTGLDGTLPPWTSDDPAARKSLQFSLMRRTMADECDYRVALGGQTVPASQARTGYGGRYPGIAEEAWWTLRARKPLYVVGGFGGAAALVAAVFDGAPTPSELIDDTFLADTEVRSRWDDIDAHPDRRTLDLPPSMKRLVVDLRCHAEEILSSDETARAWNGLSRVENKQLFWTRDPLRISTLILRGIQRLIAARREGRVAVELVHGDLGDVHEVDAIVVTPFSDVEVGGAALALDRRLGGQVRMARRSGRAVREIRGDGVDAGFLLVLELGPLAEANCLDAALQRTGDALADLAARCRFRRIALVTPGGSIRSDPEAALDAYISALARARVECTLVWVELDEARFDVLKARLESMDEQVDLSVHLAPPSSGRLTVAHDQTILSVSRLDDSVALSVLPPEGAAAILSERNTVVPDVWTSLTDPYVDARARGERLANSLLGPDAVAAMNQAPQSRVVVVHDEASAAIPFETMILEQRHVALQREFVRRPSLTGLHPDHRFARTVEPGKLRVLLIASIGAKDEVDAIRDAIDMAGPAVHVQEVILPAESSCARVLEALARPEVDAFHFVGHGWSGGIQCNDGKVASDDLRRATIYARMAFLNSCDSGRLVGPLTLVEYFLRGGVEVYLGPMREVDGPAAKEFAACVYRSLSGGASVSEAVLLARRTLDRMGSLHWSSYVLYGNGGLRVGE